MKYTPAHFIAKYRNRLVKRGFLNNILLIIEDRTSFSTEQEAIDEILTGKVVITPGAIFLIGGKEKNYAYISTRTADKVEIGYISKFNNTSPFTPIDKITIVKGDIENLSKSTVTTTVGRFLLNYILYVMPFGQTFEYHNDLWDIKGNEKKMVELLRTGEIKPDQIYKYEDAVFFIGHFTILAVPGFSEKSLITDPKIPALKKQLIEKYKDQLHDPVIVAKIEDELIAADKKHLKSDDSTRFYDPLGKISYNIHRKKMLLTVGGIDAFSDDANKTTFIKNSLAEGWDVNHFDQIVDEIRKGSYARGVDTAKGGDLTKYIIRIFQDVVFSNVDCKSKKGYKLNLTKDNTDKYIGRKIAGTETTLANNNIQKYVGKEVTIRSPLGCQSKEGICFTCAGKTLESMDHKSVLGMMILVTSTFMDLSMATMHGTKLQTTKITSVDEWLYN